MNERPDPMNLSLPADQMLTRFTADLWKLAQDGGMTLKDGNSSTTWVSKALTAFAMQMYYEDTANATNKDKQLFDVVTGGIRFDMDDVSQKFKTAFDNGQALTLTDAKGFDQYFKYYLDNNLDIGDVNFNLAETVLIKSILPYMRDWYVQAGTSGLATTDDKNRGAFMLGGTGSDALVGGSVADLLVGNAGDDVLMGDTFASFALVGDDAIEAHLTGILRVTFAGKTIRCCAKMQKIKSRACRRNLHTRPRASSLFQRKVA